MKTEMKSKITYGSNGIKLIEELFSTLQKIAYKNVSQEYYSGVKELEIHHVDSLKKKMEIVSKYPPFKLPTGDYLFQDEYDLAPPIRIPKLYDDKWVKAKITTSKYIDITELAKITTSKYIDITELDLDETIQIYDFMPKINIGYNDDDWTSIHLNKDGKQSLEPWFWDGESEANLAIFGDLYQDNKLAVAENDWMVSKSDEEIPKETPYVIVKLLKQNLKNVINAEITKIGGKDPLKIAFCHFGDEEEKLEILEI